jgi:predicted ABC-type ATPase
MVQKFETTFSSAEIIKLVGIRKDNKFMMKIKMVRLNNCQHMMKKIIF